MGGAGGFTCMSDDAQREIKEFIEMHNNCGNLEIEAERMRMGLLAKAMAMANAGIIPHHADPDQIIEDLKAAPWESLR